MDVYTNSEYDGASLGDMLEFGQNPDMEGGEYYKSLHRQQMATNKLVKQLQKNDEETPFSDTWDSQRDVQGTHLEHHRGPELKPGGVAKKKAQAVEPTVRLRKAMGFELRPGEPVFDEKSKGWPTS